MVTNLTNYGKQIRFLLSTDDPTEVEWQNGDLVFLMDQDKLLIFDADNTDFKEISMGGGGGGGGSILPAGYTQLEFVASDGVAWLNTGEYRQAGDELDIYGGLLRAGGAVYWHPFGTGNCFVQVDRLNLPTASATVRINSAGNQQSLTVTTMLCHTMVTDTQLAQYSSHGHDETVVLDVAGTVSTDTLPMALFARKTAGSADYPANGFAIFNFRWYRAGVLIHNMVPAMRDADDVLGMYDTVTNTFLTNAAGSGAFWGETID